MSFAAHDFKELQQNGAGILLHVGLFFNTFE